MKAAGIAGLELNTRIDKLAADGGAVVGTVQHLSGEDPELTWPVVPGRSYNVWRRSDLSSGTWIKLNASAITAVSGDDELSFTDDTASGSSNFYRIEWIAE